MKAKIIKMQAQAELIPQVVEKIAGIGQTSGLDTQACFEIQVVIAEALNNIIEHSLADIEGQNILILCRKVENAFEVNIIDKGEQLNKIPQWTVSEPGEENGRGWPIIFQWTDEVAYQNISGENHLMLKKSLPTH